MSKLLYLPVFLIGFMCSGKTTLGRKVAQATGRDFIDLDDLVEAQAGMSIPEIFKTEGEAAFRRREQDALKSACTKGAPIIACGGGTPCAPGAMELMNQIGITVYLKPNTERLIARLMDGREKRPLIAGISSKSEMAKFASQKIAEREPFYSLSSILFDSSLLESDQEVEETANRFISEIMSTSLSS